MSEQPSDRGPQPARVHGRADLARELERLRVRAARGSGRNRVSLDRIARLTGIPRSTVHSYIRGTRLPPADALDAIVLALGATPAEQGAWARALERVADQLMTRRAVAAPVPRRLPSAPADFRGRDGELRALAAAVAGRGAGAPPPVVAVTGPSGVGKTALVLHWAHRSAELFPDGALWVDLRGTGRGPFLAAADALERLLVAVGVAPADVPAGLGARVALFRSAVVGRRMLLVVDNARDAAHVLPLLPGTPGFATVVTGGDELGPLAGREGAARLGVAPWDGVAAAEFLLGGAAGGTPEGAGGAAAVLAAARIADCCAGLPLALRIVRERLDGSSAATLERVARELAAAAEPEGDPPETDPPDPDPPGTDPPGTDPPAGEPDPPAGPGLRPVLAVLAVLAWAYRQLPPDAARMLRRLPIGVVPTLDLATIAVLADHPPPAARRSLDTLVAAGLLDLAGPAEYRLHELVAAFAADRLAAEEPPEAVAEARRRLLEHLLASR